MITNINKSKGSFHSINSKKTHLKQKRALQIQWHANSEDVKQIFS